MSRIRQFALVSYVSEPQSFIDLIPDINQYAYILHDMDDCVSHYHIYLSTYNAHTISAIVDKFKSYDINGEKINTFSEPVRKKSALLAYFTHRDSPDKYQYDDSKVISNFDFSQNDINDDNLYLNMFDDFISDVDFRVMVNRYGRDFLFNIQRLSQAYDYYLAQKSRQEYRQRHIDLIPKSDLPDIVQKRIDELKH